MKLNKLININLNQTISRFEMLEIQKEKIDGIFFHQLFLFLL